MRTFSHVSDVYSDTIGRICETSVWKRSQAEKRRNASLTRYLSSPSGTRSCRNCFEKYVRRVCPDQLVTASRSPDVNGSWESKCSNRNLWTACQLSSEPISGSSAEQVQCGRATSRSQLHHGRSGGRIFVRHAMLW